MLAMPPNFRILRGCQKRQTPTEERDGKVKNLEVGWQASLECGKCAECFCIGLSFRPSQYD